MSNYKKKFELDVLFSNTSACIKIIGEHPKSKTYVKIENSVPQLGDGYFMACIKEKDLELFAVNILRALKSKRLK